MQIARSYLASVVCMLPAVCGCGVDSESAELLIVRISKSGRTREMVAFVNPQKLHEAGVTEDAFREEVINVYAADVFEHTVGKVLVDSFGVEDAPSEDEGGSKRSLHEVKDPAIRALLDEHVQLEVREIRHGKTRVIRRLVVDSNGIVDAER